MSGRSDRAVVVVTHNSAEDLAGCLRPLASEDVILVDNASSDGSAGLALRLHPDATVVCNPGNVGFSRAVNQGLALAEGRDVFLANPDLRIQPAAIDRLAQTLEEHSDAGLVAPLLRHPDGLIQDSARSFPSVATMAARRTLLGRTAWGRCVATSHTRPTSKALAGPQPVDWALGAALYIRAAALADVGGLDERFFLYEEDIDWCGRMWQSGWAVLYEPRCEAQHGYRRASRRTWDLRSAATRHHWASVARLTTRWPAQILLGRPLPRGRPSPPTNA